MIRRFVCLAATLLLAACGDDAAGPAAPEGPGTPGRWEHCRVDGLASASGLSTFGDDVLAVAGGNDREVYVVARGDLRHETPVRARTLAVDISPERSLMGAEDFALQGYKMSHLWPLTLDFQGLAVQEPDYVYLGDRVRRVVYWGRLVRDAAGRLARVKLAGVTVAPGAVRSGVVEGDWRDRGPGLAGLVALRGRQRMEDLYVLDEAPGEGGVLRIRRMDRYGSPLGTLPVAAKDDGLGPCRAISWDGGRYLVHRGAGRGRTWSFREPEPMRSARPGDGVPGPLVEGVEAWTGMAHAADGTIFMVSNGSPAILAWRRP